MESHQRLLRTGDLIKLIEEYEIYTSNFAAAIINFSAGNSNGPAK